MARVTAPLFSGAASGQFSDICEFRMVNGKAVVTGTKTRRKPLAAATQVQASRFSTAAAEWRALSEEQQDQWVDAGYMHGLTGYQLYIREYLTQGITPPGQPTIPT